ncbi:MAG: hypothetical protein MI867_22625 [Pseudomonadales bacterium]|nr:hypothetical protein [Pseudomonadales bacterium]
MSIEDSFCIITVKAEFLLYGEDRGGRSLPVSSGYNPNHKFDESSYYMGRISFSDSDDHYPGEMNIVEIDFISSAGLEERLQPGYSWSVTEGGNIVGEAKLTEILQKKSVVIDNENLVKVE